MQRLKTSKKWRPPLLRGFHVSLVPQTRLESHGRRALPCKALCGFAAHVGKSDGSRAPRTPEGIQRVAALHQMQRRPYSVLECWSCRLSRCWTFNGVGPEIRNSRMPCSISLTEKGFLDLPRAHAFFPACLTAPPNAIETSGVTAAVPKIRTCSAVG